jgi:para-aminobenzoate synthetase component 1
MLAWPQLNKQEALEQMDLLGKQRIPFLFIIDFEMQKPLVLPLSAIDNNQLLYFLDGSTNCEAASQPNKQTIIFESQPITYKQYLQSFDVVQNHLKNGNSYLVNLTQPTPVKLNIPLKSVFLNSTARFRLWLANEFVVFSPELFVKTYNNHLFSYPMKGTIDANEENAAEKILNDSKELAEHHTIVDLIRNDLNRVSKKVSVNKFRYIDRIRTHKGDLLQVSSEISGQLECGWQQRCGTILFDLLPAGSISGAPKKKTLAIINEAENYTRGYYTGVFGVFDGKDILSAVMIRYIENTPTGLIFKSGGGITIHSDAQSEYNELIQKVYVPLI